jgi:hypothetical protein
MNVRTEAPSERVPMVQGLAIMVSRRDRDAGANGVAGAHQRPEICTVGDPQRGNNKVLPTAVAKVASLPAEITGRGLRAAHLSSLGGSYQIVVAHVQQHRQPQLDLKAFRPSDDSDRDHLAALPRRLLVEQVELPGDEWVVLQVLNCPADDVVDVCVDRDLVERRRRDALNGLAEARYVAGNENGSLTPIPQ